MSYILKIPVESKSESGIYSSRSCPVSQIPYSKCISFLSPFNLPCLVPYFFFRGLLQQSLTDFLNVECLTNFFKNNIPCYRIALSKDLQWHSISHRMKSRFLPAGSNCSNMHLSFSPAYLRPLLISSFLSIRNPPSSNGFLLPLLLFISLVTFSIQLSIEPTFTEPLIHVTHAAHW